MGKKELENCQRAVTQKWEKAKLALLKEQQVKSGKYKRTWQKNEKKIKRMK